MNRRSILLFVLGTSLYTTGDAAAAVPTQVQILAASGTAAGKVLHVRSMSLPETNVEAYAAKVLMSDDTIEVVVLDGKGASVSHDALVAAEQQAAVAKYGKLTPRLYRFLQAAAPSQQVPLDIWTKVDASYPSKDLVMKDSATLAAHQAETQANLAAATAPVVLWLTGDSSPLLNMSASSDVTSPLVKTTLVASRISALAGLDRIAWIDLDLPGEPASTVWYTNTAVASARALTTASGVTGCVVESDRPASATYLRISATASPSGYTTSHAQAVAGIMSNSYNATSVTDGETAIGNWDQFTYNSTYPSMWAWCNAQGTPVENFSWTTESGTDPNFGSIDSQIDWYAKNYPYPLIVTAAGNDSGYCQNKNRNGLVIGGSDDKGTTSTGDDTLYSASSWRNPGTTHGDFELPGLVAPALSIDSANLTNNSGTSFSTAQVSGAAMLLVGRDGNIAGWPEEMRAVLLATATANVDGSAFSALPASDIKDGTGRLNTYNAAVLADPLNSVGVNNTSRANGRSHVTMSLTNDFTNGFYNSVWNIQPSTTGHIRVIAAWDGTASCSGQGGTNCTESLDADLDLYLYGPGGTLLCISSSYDSPWEGCDVSVTSGSQYTVKIFQSSRNQSSTYLGLAWFNY